MQLPVHAEGGAHRRFERFVVELRPRRHDQLGVGAAPIARAAPVIKTRIGKR